MKRRYAPTEFQSFCRKMQDDLRPTLFQPEDDGELTILVVTLGETSFHSHYYATRTLAKLFITASCTQRSHNISLDIRCMPPPVYWKMIFACLGSEKRRTFHVQVADYDAFYDVLLGLGYVTIERADQINNEQLYIFTIEVEDGILPVFDTTDDIPIHVQDVIAQPLNKNNHVHKPVDPARVYAIGPIIPNYISDIINAICSMDAAEAMTTLPFILSIPPFLRVFGYSGPMELAEVSPECRDAVDFIGYIVLKCLCRAYIGPSTPLLEYDDDSDDEDEVDLNGYPLLMMKVWMNACFGRYSGTEASTDNLEIEIDMPPSMTSESILQCWMITYLDNYTHEQVQDAVTRPFLKKFARPLSITNGDTMEGDSRELIGNSSVTSVSFDDIMSTPAAIDGFLSDIIATASLLLKRGVHSDPMEIGCRLSVGYMALGFCDAFCMAYDEMHRRDPIFLRLFEILPSHLFPQVVRAPLAIRAAIVNYAHEPDVEMHASPARKLLNQTQTKMVAGHVLRQAIEFKPVVLAAAYDVTSMPFVVQGESFVLPYHSISSSPLILYLNQVAALHLSAFALASSDAFSGATHDFVELPSHTFLYNQGPKQHDYMYFFETWENKQLPGSPVVFTGIINLSSRAMVFGQDFAGRAVANTATLNQRLAQRLFNRANTETVVILPGCMHMYERKVCEKDNGGRSYTFQTRLSNLSDYYDAAELPYVEDHADVYTEGVFYMQMSIAVYPRTASKKTKTALHALKDQKNMGFIGGLQQSSIYQGKQASTSGDDGFVDLKKKTKRYPYPLLYNQLTNAHQSDTRWRFIGNYMMQREEISRCFYQDVLFIYNGSATDVDKRIKLVIPKGGRAYDAQKHALDINVQCMSYPELHSSGRLASAYRRTDNNSTYTTREELIACTAAGDAKYTRIYPCIMPPLRHLHALPGLFSKRDHYATSTALGLVSQFTPFAIQYVRE